MNDQVNSVFLVTPEIYPLLCNPYDISLYSFHVTVNPLEIDYFIRPDYREIDEAKLVFAFGKKFFCDKHICSTQSKTNDRCPAVANMYEMCHNPWLVM